MSATLRVEGVSVTFGEMRAVDDVSFSVHAGEVVGLIGPNGAGKTVLFNAVTGLQSCTAGTVHIRGIDVTRMAASQRVQLGVARTFQIPQLFAGMSVRRNLMVAAHRFTRSNMLTDALSLPGRRRALTAAAARAEAALDFLGLGQLADIDVSALPIGQARQVELARALCLKPRLLLLDESASGLDAAETDDFVGVLRRVRAVTGCSILLVEHDMSVVSRLCDHVVVMNTGRLIAAGTPAAVRADPAVQSAYLGTAVNA